MRYGKTASVLLVLLLAASTSLAQAKLDSYSLEPSYVEPGDDVDIYVKITEGLTKREIFSTPTKDNEKLPIGGEKDSYYVATLSAKDTVAKRYVTVKQTERNIGHLFAGESWTIPFAIYVSETAPTTTYTLEFNVLSYSKDGSDEPVVVLSKDIPVEVRGSPSFTVNADTQLNAGETSKFRVSVNNVGGGAARDVQVQLNTTASITVLGSCCHYLGDMSGGSYKALEYTLHVDSSTDPKAYILPVKITYVDRAGNTQSVSKDLGVKVQGTPRVEANIDEQDELAPGVEGMVSVAVINKGFIDVKFLSMQVEDTEDYEVTSNSEIYIGNLASDDFETEDFTVKPREGVSGTIPLKVKVSYIEENKDETHVMYPEVNLDVSSAQEYARTHGNGGSAQAVIGLLFVIPALIVGYLVLWLTFKVVSSLTTFIDRKLFRRSNGR